MVRSGYFYPAAGYRNSAFGTFGNTGSIGYVLSSALSGTSGFLLTLYSTNVNPTHVSPRAYGFAVRCVQNLLLLKKSNLLFG